MAGLIKNHILHLLQVLFLLLFLNTATASEQTQTELSNSTNNRSASHSDGIFVAHLALGELSFKIQILGFLLFVLVVKIIYSHLPRIAAYIPESSVLIAVGVVFGCVLRFGGADIKNWSLTPDLFFFVLLPPIILDASYTIHNRTFGENLGVILIFAVLGTICNFLIIGISIYYLSTSAAMGSPVLSTLTLKSCLLFSSIIVAVDPVAVLAIFEDMGVNKGLYYMVFGESLLNDAVTIVLYEIMVAFIQLPVISGREVGIGCAKFLCVSLGAFIIGVAVGLISCLITRFSHRNRIIEPIIILLLCYFAYILGDLFGWSGIIAMIGCGLTQAHYAFHNISEKSTMLVTRIAHMAASIAEATIFLYLGLEIILRNLVWHTGFHLWSLVMCLLSRGVIVFVLCAIINCIKVDMCRISFKEQFIITYGGLRGGVAFCLAVLITPTHLIGGDYERQLYLTSTMFVVFVTSIFMGITMKPLANLVHVKLAVKNKLSVMSELNKCTIDHLMAGIEEISGENGRNHYRDKLRHIVRTFAYI